MPALTLAFRTVLAGFIAGASLWLILRQIEGSGMDSGGWVLFWAFAQTLLYFAFLFALKVIRPLDVESLVKSFTKLKG